MGDLSKTTYVMSMPPINSSGDIYHVLSFLMLTLNRRDFPIPRIELTFDAQETKEQAERSFKFTEALGYNQYFNVLQLESGGYRQNARQDKLSDSLIQRAHSTQSNIHYLDQKASTSYLAYHFLQDKPNTIGILNRGYKQRALPIQEQHQLLEEYANYWIRNISLTRQPTIILHIRYSAEANSKQNLPGDFLTKFSDYIKSKTGYNVWYIFADGRTKGSFPGITEQRISPFSLPLKKDKQHYGYLSQLLQKLNVRNPGYDYGKLLHLQLLLTLQDAREKYDPSELSGGLNLKGIIGNTSGTLDLAGFIGHNVYNIHTFTQPQISYQDYRMLVQMSFLTVEAFQDTAFKTIAARKYSFDREDLAQILRSYNNWEISQQLSCVPPAINFNEPNYTNAGFWELLYYKIINPQSRLEETMFSRVIQELVRTVFATSAAQYNLGLKYATGSKVAKNYSLALFWLNRAIEQNYPVEQELIISLNNEYLREAIDRRLVSIEELMELDIDELEEIGEYDISVALDERGFSFDTLVDLYRDNAEHLKYLTMSDDDLLKHVCEKAPNIDDKIIELICSRDLLLEFEDIFMQKFLENAPNLKEITEVAIKVGLDFDSVCESLGDSVEGETCSYTIPNISQMDFANFMSNFRFDLLGYAEDENNKPEELYEELEEDESVLDRVGVSKKLDIDDSQSVQQAIQESLLSAEKEGITGPRNIPGWILEDVEDKGNCFYDAIIHQMKLINHVFLLTVHNSTLPRDSLRLWIQGVEFRDGEWAGQIEIEKLARRLDVIVAIIDTRDKTRRFVYHYIDDTNNYKHTPNQLNLDQKLIIKLAFTGNHYLSVVATADDILDYSFTKQFSSFSLFKEMQKEYIINNRHESPQLQREYDKRFGLIARAKHS